MSQYEKTSPFDAIGDQWWNEQGPFKHLHQMNPIRLEFILKSIRQHFPSLENLNILDVGCGGGLLCEPLARLGACITGLDENEKAIEIAKKHAVPQELNIKYVHGHFDTLKEQNKLFDVVTALEVVEHVDDVKGFIKNCTDLLKPGGLLFISTLNRTWKSYLFAIIGAEYIMRILPIGTHEWHKFLTPSEVIHHMQFNKLEAINFTGIVYSPLNRTWRLERDLDVNYIGYAQKEHLTVTEAPILSSSKKTQKKEKKSK